MIVPRDCDLYFVSRLPATIDRRPICAAHTALPRRSSGIRHFPTLTPRPTHAPPRCAHLVNTSPRMTILTVYFAPANAEKTDQSP